MSLLAQLFQFLLVCNANYVDSHMSSTFSTGMMAAVIEYLQPSSNYIVFSSLAGLNEKKILTRIEKNISSLQDVPVVALDFQALFNFINGPHVRIDRPLFTIITNDQETRYALQQLTHRIPGSKIFWLLFLDQAWQLEDFLLDFMLSFDSVFLVVQSINSGILSLSDVYRVTPNYPLRVSHMGTWSSSSGHDKWPNLEKYERRNDLEGIEFQVATINSPPVTVLEKRGKQSLLVRGYFYEAWRILETKLNFTTSYHIPSDNSCGRVSDDHKWNGLIGMVVRKKVHLAIADLQMTSYRKNVVDFTIPLLFTRIRVFLQEPEEILLRWTSFLQPFSPALWCAALTTIFVLATFLTALNLQSHSLSVYKHFTFYDSVFYVYGLFCGQGCPMIPDTLPCRMMLLCAAIVGVVLTAAYSATLVSFQAVQTSELPFNSLEDMLADKSYTFSVLANSALYSIFQHAEENKLLKNLYNHLVAHGRDPLPTTTKDGLSQLCRGHYTFMTEYDVASVLLPQVPCRLIMLPYQSYTSSIAIAMEKNSSFRGIFDYLLYKLTNGGVLKRLRSQTWILASTLHSEVKFSEVHFLEVVPLLMFLISGVVVSTLFLLIERLFYTMMTKKQTCKLNKL